MGLLSRIFGRKSVPPTAVVEDPTLGQFNLVGNDATELMVLDREVLAPLFVGDCQVTTDAPPQCDVLLTYAHFENDGRISGTTLGWREIIRDSGSKVAIVATENDPDAYMEAVNDPGYGYANFVLTIERNGDHFVEFYRKLFAAMFDGKSMPVAWVELAPQIPDHDHADCPEGVFACELGQLIFRLQIANA